MNNISGRSDLRRFAFTLVELLAVIAIIGLLMAILLPAINGARSAARRAQCQNNLRQVAIAANTYLATNETFPAGSIAKAFPEAPATPWTFYRWSALAQVLPFIEEATTYRGLQLEVPLYGPDFKVTEQNRQAVRQIIPTFLCPSDYQEVVNPNFGPTNYAMCAGSGINGGSPTDTDGIFFVNSATTAAHIRDGLSKTILAAETSLGRKNSTNDDPQRDYKFLASAPLTMSLCQQTPQWNVSDPRGFSWANGEFRCALFNNHLMPNSPDPDCMGVVTSGRPAVRFTPYGWRGARSQHPGVVAVALADGSNQFVENDVDEIVWRSMSTVSD